jgi:hypothetical protein
MYSYQHKPKPPPFQPLPQLFINPAIAGFMNSCYTSRMPSTTFRHGRRKYYTRYELLKQLERQERFVHALDDFFSKITAGVARTRKKPISSSGYSESTLTLKPGRSQKMRFYQLMYELRRDGLIEERNDGGDHLARITAKGLAWLKRKRERSLMSLPIYNTSGEKTDRVTIVSYDIPEKNKVLREWLRATLKNLGLRSMQRSVWIGRVKLPSDFLKDIVLFKIETRVEIFEISKAGTLRHLL